jgi:glycosyltransferase involved in cell wall biosynthesis
VNHVAFVIPGIDRVGGAERQVILLARGLAGRGWRVSMVALSGSGSDAAGELEAAGVSFVSLRMWKGLADPRGWIRFHRWIRRERPDVVHAHLPHATWMARISRLLAPVRVVIDTVHTSSTGTRGRRLAYRMTDRLSDCVTAVSGAVADAYLSARLVSPHRMAVLPNGIDLEEWRPDGDVRARVRGELGLHDEFLWCAVGRLEPVKDYPALLRALVGLPESAWLVIAGSGVQQSELKSLCDQFGIAERVRFLGFQKEVRPWMQAADGFVLSSLWEGLPMTLLEASACAVPCVATGVGGTREIIVDGETGYIAQPQSVESLRRAMMRLMQMRPENRESMGLDARQRIAEQFSVSAVLDRWERLFCDLLEQNPAAQRYASTASGGTRHRAPPAGQARGGAASGLWR